LYWRGGLIFTNCATPEIENKPISTDPILDRENSVFDFESLIYATDEELGIEDDNKSSKSVKSSDGIVDVELAIEYITKIVMPSLIEEGTIPADSSLSEKPIVIYDVDGKPEFYEFRISDNTGNQIGTFTTVGKESMGFIEAYHFEYKLDYTSLIEPLVRDSYLSRNKSVRIISNDYPNCVIGVGTVETGRFNTERVFSQDAREISKEEIRIPLTVSTLLEDYREELLKDYTEEELIQIENELEEIKISEMNEWKLLNDNKGHIEDVIKPYYDKSEPNTTVLLPNVRNFINSYYNGTAEYPLGGECGAAATNWNLEYMEYRNLFGTPNVNDYDCDSQANFDLLKQKMNIGDNGILWPGQMYKGYKYFTGDEYTVKYFPFNWWNELKKNIKTLQLPVTSLIVGWSSTTGSSIFLPWHYRPQVGYKVVGGKRKFWIYDLNMVAGPDASIVTRAEPYWEYWRAERHWCWADVREEN